MAQCRQPLSCWGFCSFLLIFFCLPFHRRGKTLHPNAYVPKMTTTRLNLGPLTTNTWTYTCNEVIQACSDCKWGWAAQTCQSTGGGVTDNQDCWPPRATNVPATEQALHGWGVYSPGLFW